MDYFQLVGISMRYLELTFPTAIEKAGVIGKFIGASKLTHAADSKYDMVFVQS